MNEELKIIIRAVTEEAQKSIEKVKKELQGVSRESQSTSAKFGAAMKGIAKAATIAITAVVAITTAIVAFGKSTLDIQKQTAQLNSAFQAAGKTAADAANVYKGFFRFLGDSDTAIEASNLLIKLTQDEQNLTQWTKILQGVYASFPDSLPIEGLVESANETARVGVVTGNLADALNWAGASEEAFNEKLAQTTTLEEREALIRSTLNNLYGVAAENYERNNSAILAYNESQANAQRKSAELGATITPLLIQLNNLGAAIMSYLKPALEKVLPYIAGFVMWLTEAINRTAVVTNALSSSGESIKAVGDTTAKALDKATGGTNKINSGLKDIKKNAEAARKAAMGFDELNIVPSDKSSSSSGLTGGTGALDGLDYSAINNAAASLEEFQKKTEEIAKQISEFMDKWGGLLKLIGSLLAALSIKNLIIRFGEAIGLGEKFAKILSFTGVSAVLSKIAGWLSTVIALLKEGNKFWAVMGAAFPKIAGVLAKIGAAIKGISFKGILSGIGKVASKFGWIGLIIAAVISAISYAIKYWNDVVRIFKTFISETMAPLFQKIKDKFIEMGEAITSAIPPSWIEWLKGAFAWLGNAIKVAWDWIKNAVAWIGEAFTWLWDVIGGAVFHTTVGVIMSAINGIISLILGIVDIITGVVQIVVGIIETVVKTIIAIFTGNWEAVLEPLKKIWEGVKNIFIGLYDGTIGVVVELVKGIISWFTELWDVLVGHSIVPDMVEAIIEWFKELPSKIFDLIANFVQTIIDFFANLATKLGEWAVTAWEWIKAPFVAVGNWFGDVFKKAYNATTGAFKNAKTGFSNVWSNIKAGFGNVSDWFKNTFTSAWTAVKNVFSKGGKIFDGIKDGILEGLKTVINGLIGGINKVIAAPFNGINKALKTLKDIEIVGIKPFDWISTINVPEIPLLAKGGIINEATLAMIGERGKEAVVPLENNTEWMDKLVDKLAARNQAPTRIVLQLDGKELGWANINSINNITKQTGALQLVLS